MPKERMMRKHLLMVAAGTLLVLPAAGSTPLPSAVPSDQEIRSILQKRIDAYHQGVGIVVGVIEPKGRRVIAYGSLGKGDARPLNGETMFEIGSVTKVFTSLLLADMVQHGEVALTDPVAKFLPEGVKVPQRNGKSITLQDLSNQTSGLPRMPDNFAPKDPANPYADYSPDQLFQFLATYQLTRDIGSKFEYSNLGVGLLGQALSHRAGMTFEALVRTRIAMPLGMTSTVVALTPEMKARLAVGHDGSLTPVANWDIPTLAGAGALRSDVDDMLTFLADTLGYTKSRLAPAMASMLAPRKPTGMPGLDIALAWLVSTREGAAFYWHNGGTGGYRSFLGFNPTTRVGVVVLSNMSNEAGVDDIGKHLLDPSLPLMSAPKEHKEIALDPKRLDSFTGQYQLTPEFILTVTREGDGLFVQATGQPKGQIFPEGERAFFAKMVNAQFTFEPDVNGKASGLVLHQGGRDLPAKRIGDGPANVAPPAPAVHREISVDPKLFDRYVGRYALSPAFILTITREGDHLFAQATNQPKFELFAESNTAFFLKVVDAQISFDNDAEGKALGLTLHQGGAHLPAKRLGD
jgi:CubicO group peptidase (beta-lactamase class C family)